jgi:hypothetical protein
VNSLPFNEGNAIVSIGFKAANNGEFSLLAEEDIGFDPGTRITLEDLKTGEMKDLRNHSCHLFTYAINDDPERFRLHFTRFDAVEYPAGRNPIHISSMGQSVKVYHENPCECGLISVYDLRGKELVCQFMQGSRPVTIPLSVSAGVYLVKVVCDKDLATRKIYIH